MSYTNDPTINVPITSPEFWKTIAAHVQSGDIPATKLATLRQLAEATFTPPPVKAYVFEAKLTASVTIQATSEEAARTALRKLLDSLDPSEDFIAGFNFESNNILLTESTLFIDSEPTLTSSQPA